MTSTPPSSSAVSNFFTRTVCSAPSPHEPASSCRASKNGVRRFCSRRLRPWWEPDCRNFGCDGGGGEKWVPLCKGGAFAPFYYDPHLVVRWSYRRATYVGFIGTEHRPLEKPAGLEHFFRPGITWPVRTGG